MRILLTGSDGYLGAVMAPVLAARGHDVTGLDAGFYRDGALYEPEIPPPPVITGDIRHLSVADLAGFDAVVHLAELSNDPLGEHNPEATYAINGDGSARLARLAREAGVRRFVYSSSCSVYGIGGGEWKTEASAVEPLTAYAACKLRTEEVLHTLAGRDFSPTCLRNATAYGASPRMRFDIVLNQFAGLAWTAGRIEMSSDGTPWRPLVHAADLADAFACVLDAPIEAVHDQVLNVGSNDENYRVRDIADAVAEVFPDCTVAFGRSDHDGRSYRVSFDKIADRLPGFSCKWNARRGAEQLRGVFAEIALTQEQFEFRGFRRLAQLQHLRASGELDDRLFWRRAPAAA